jgi:DNA-binding CsgD family transcriptional regulator
MAARDILDIVEAAYDLDSSDDDWLRRMAEVVRPHVDRGFGVAAFEYFLPADGTPRIVRRCHLGMPEPLAEIYPSVFETMDPEIRRRPFRMGPCITGSQLMGQRSEFRDEPHMKRHVQRFGMYDSLWITAAEPTGRGCGFHAGRPTIGWPTRAEVARWGRIAAHLAAAVRLRYRVRSLGGSASAVPEAVLDPGGTVRDASGAATTNVARDLLQRAVAAFERARGSMRATAPDASLADWKALVAGRWSLVDRIDQDGRRYVLARENGPAAPGPALFTPRERQVVACAKLGHHNKLIAYELGIADSTVRVLLGRAAAKVGARTRGELLRAVEDQEPWQDEMEPVAGASLPPQDRSEPSR